MPEFDFYITKDEVRNLIGVLFKHNLSMTIDKDYETESTVQLKSIIDYDQYVNSRYGGFLFFLTHKDYTSQGFLMGNFERDGKTFYYISQRYGGPDIHLMFFVLEGKEPLCSGNISHYPFYYYLDGSKNTDLKEIPKYYKIMCDVVRKISVKTKIGKRSYYISKEAAQVIKEKNIELP